MKYKNCFNFGTHNLLVVERYSEEWKEFHDIQRYSLFELREEDHYDPDYHDSGGSFSINPPSSRLSLMLKHEGRAVGITTLDLWPDNRAVMRGVAIRQDARGLGHGRALGSLVATFAHAQGVGELMVNADPAKVGYYQRLGFTTETWSDSELELWRNGGVNSTVPVQMVKRLTGP